MANGNNNVQPTGVQRPLKKADVIIRNGRELSAKQDMLSEKQDLLFNEAQQNNQKLDSVLGEIAKSRQVSEHITLQNGNIFEELKSELDALKREFKFLATQNESIYSQLTEKIEAVGAQPEAQSEQPAGAAVAAEEKELDYDLLAEKVAARMPVQEAQTAVVPELDYDLLAEKVAAHMPAPEAQTAVVPELDYDLLAEKVAARMPAASSPVVVAAAPAAQEVNYELLADKVASRIPVGEAVSPDYIASKVAEQIVIPEIATAAVDSELIAKKVAENIVVPEAQAAVELDYDYLADKVVARMPVPEAQTAVVPELDYDYIADKVVARMPVPETQTAVASDIDCDALAEKVSEKIVIPEVQAAVVSEIDYEALAEKVSERFADRPVESVIVGPEVDCNLIASKVAEQIIIPETKEIDYDLLAEKVTELMPEQTAAPAEAAELDYELLADKVASRITVSQYDGAPVAVAAAPVSVDIDEDELADRIAIKVGALKAEDFDVLVDDEGCNSITDEIAEKLNYGLIADTIAEKLRPVFENEEEPDYDEMASRISEKITVAGVNEDAIADKAAAVLSNYLPEIDTDEIADKVASQLAGAMPTVDNEYISTSISDRLIEAQADKDYDIVIDEDEVGKLTDRLTEASEERFNALDKEVAELKSMIENGVTVRDTEETAETEEAAEEAFDFEERFAAIDGGLSEIKDMLENGVAVKEDSLNQPDYEEMATRISENITVAGVDEDAIAQKAAAVLQEYVFNTDEIADKVSGRVIEALPEVDNTVVAAAVSEKLSENEREIVIDEDGLNLVTETVTEKVTKANEERFTAIDGELAEIKEILANGVAVRGEIAGAAAYDEQYIAEETPLVTVSGVITGEEPEEAEEVTEEEVPDEPAEEVPEEEVIEESVVEEPEEASEEPAGEVTEEVEEEPLVTVSEVVNEAEAEAGVEEETEEADEAEDDGPVEEFTFDDLAGGEESEEANGVDFANMMRYNRSFIARIIQGTDEQKNYYGEVRNALLSYKKVNSNIAWGAERFHKGRETIARFKIRGKTLVIYLAVNPADYAESVYHHKDVSDNKSVAGTPMMIKVKSPRGVKKAVRLIDEMLLARNGVKRNIPQRDYAAMYPFETIEELIEDGLVKDVRKNK